MKEKKIILDLVWRMDSKEIRLEAGRLIRDYFGNLDKR